MSDKGAPRHHCGNPERDLISEVLHRAIRESISMAAINGVRRDAKKGMMMAARFWLTESDISKYYCDLLDICHESMIDRLRPKWK